MKSEIEFESLPIQLSAHENSKSKGFWDDCPIALEYMRAVFCEGDPSLSEKTRKLVANYIAAKLMLIVSECSEALEDLRTSNFVTSELPSGKPVGFPSELADVQIRLWDLSGACGIDLLSECERKMAYNATRPRMHGKVI